MEAARRYHVPLCFKAHKTEYVQIAPYFFFKGERKKSNYWNWRVDTSVWISDGGAGVKVETSETKVWAQLNDEGC